MKIDFKKSFLKELKKLKNKKPKERDSGMYISGRVGRRPHSD